MKVHHSAYVFLNDTFVGTLERLNFNRGFSFTYDKSYIANGGHKISLSLPLTATPYISELLHPFFSGLCSEGWMREVQCLDQEIARTDEFTVLTANGAELIGAITIFPAD